MALNPIGQQMVALTAFVLQMHQCVMQDLTGADHGVCSCVPLSLTTFVYHRGTCFCGFHFSLFFFFKTIEKSFPCDSDSGIFAKMKELPVNSVNFSRNFNCASTKY